MSATLPPFPAGPRTRVVAWAACRVLELACVAIPVPLPGTGAGRRAGFSVSAVCSRGHGKRAPGLLELSHGSPAARDRADADRPDLAVRPGLVAARLLVGYKAAPSRQVRCQRQASLCRLLGEFLSLHLPCLIGPVLDDRHAALAVPVPSTSAPRPSWGGEHPLIGIIRTALATEPGSSWHQYSRRVPSRSGTFEPAAEASAWSVPWPDSKCWCSTTPTLPALAPESAAVALASGGADVAAIVPIGRLIHPDHSGTRQALSGRTSSKNPSNPVGVPARASSGQKSPTWRDSSAPGPL